MKNPNYEIDDPGDVFSQDAKDEQYKRYKYVCYRKLIIKSLLAFLLGMLTHFLLLRF